MNGSICPHCGQSHQPGTRFCPVTGQPILEARFCLNCGAAIDDPTWKACPNCGIVFAEARAFHPKKRTLKTPLLYGAVFIGIIFLVCVGVFFLLGLNRTNQTARMVPPERTGILVSLSPSLWQLSQLRNMDNLMKGVAVFAVVPGVVETGQMIQNYLPTDLKIDPQADILPWIGREVGVAVFLPANSHTSTPAAGKLALPAPQISANYRGTPLLFAAATRNSKVSDAFLENLRNQMEQEDVEFEELNYQGIRVTHIVAPNNIPLAYATYNRMVVIATDMDTLFASIDAALGNNSTAIYEENAYRDTLSSLPQNHLGTIFVNVKALTQNNEDILVAMPSRSYQAIQEIGIAFGLEANGLKFNYLVNYNKNELSSVNLESLSQRANSRQLANFAPTDTIFYYSGQNLSLVWDNFVDSVMFAEISGVSQNILQDIQPGADSNQQVADFVDELAFESGVHLKNDLLTNMNGDYAWFLTPNANNNLFGESLPVDFVFLTQVENTPQVENSLADLFIWFAQDSRDQFYKDSISGNKVWIYEDQSGNNLWGYSLLDNMLLASTSTNSLQAILEGQADSLANGEAFQAALKPLPKNNQGYLYLDVQEAIRLAYNQMSDQEKRTFNKEMRPYVDAIQTLSMASEPLNKDGTLRGVFFILTNGDINVPQNNFISPTQEETNTPEQVAQAALEAYVSGNCETYLRYVDPSMRSFVGENCHSNGIFSRIDNMKVVDKPAKDGYIVYFYGEFGPSSLDYVYLELTKSEGELYITGAYLP